MSASKNYKISDIIEMEPVSQRLRNAINRSFQQGDMPCNMLQEYVDSKEQSIAGFYGLPNVGKKTVKELIELLDRYAFGGASLSERPVNNSINIDSDLLGVPVITFISRLDGPVRLENALAFAIDKGLFPYKTLGDIDGQKLHNFKADILRVDNLGRKSTNEFLEMIKSVSGANKKGKIHSEDPNEAPVLITSEKQLEEFISLIKDEKYREYTLVDVIKESPGYSKTEENLIRNILLEGKNNKLVDIASHHINDLFEIGDFFVDDKKIGKQLSLILIGFIEFIKREKSGEKFTPIEYFNRDFDCLNDKEKTILIKRGPENKSTLEELGAEFGVTRERIRQIESLAINKYLKVNRLGLMRLRAFLKRFTKAYTGVLDIEAASHLCKTDRERLVFCLSLIAQEKDDSIYLDKGFILNQEFLKDKNEIFEEIKRSIYSNVNNFNISHNVNKKINKQILQYFVACNNRAFVLDGSGNLRVSTKSASERCKVILNFAGQPLHTREARSLYVSVFGDEVTEHAIGSTLHRMPETLIINPGTFSLYEHLKFNSADIERIKSIIFDYVSSAGEYVSSRLICEYVIQEYPDLKRKELRLNHYLIHGVVQDDGRYSVKRGFMVGLPGFGDHLPLESEIEELVEAHGPITISEIIELLRSTRGELTNGSVRNILVSSDEIFLTGDKRKWDVRSKIFKNDEDIANLEVAIQLASYHEKITLSLLYNRVRSIGLDYSLGTILSIVWKSERCILKDGYIDFFENDKKLDGYMNGEQVEKYKILDYRNFSEGKNIQTDVLDNLIKEFDINV